MLPVLVFSSITKERPVHECALSMNLSDTRSYLETCRQHTLSSLNMQIRSALEEHADNTRTALNTGGTECRHSPSLEAHAEDTRSALEGTCGHTLSSWHRKLNEDTHSALETCRQHILSSRDTCRHAPSSLHRELHEDTRHPLKHVSWHTPRLLHRKLNEDTHSALEDMQTTHPQLSRHMQMTYTQHRQTWHRKLNEDTCASLEKCRQDILSFWDTCRHMQLSTQEIEWISWNMQTTHPQLLRHMQTHAHAQLSAWGTEWRYTPSLETCQQLRHIMLRAKHFHAECHCLCFCTMSALRAAFLFSTHEIHS